MISDKVAFIVSITVMMISSILALTVYNINQTDQMAKNIESAITKGIDPISVKCSYSTGQPLDPICVLYGQSLNNSVPATIKASK